MLSLYSNINPKTKPLLDKEPLKMPLSSFCVGRLLLGMGPVLKSCLYPQWDFSRENWFFHLQVIINRLLFCFLTKTINHFWKKEYIQLIEKKLEKVGDYSFNICFLVFKREPTE